MMRGAAQICSKKWVVDRSLTIIYISVDRCVVRLKGKSVRIRRGPAAVTKDETSQCPLLCRAEWEGARE